MIMRVLVDGDEYPLCACAECGHLHWNEWTRQYERCPLADEGCQCFDDTR